jgi:hypothetical protein
MREIRSLSSAGWPFVFYPVVFGAFGAVAVAWAVLFGAGAVWSGHNQINQPGTA